jgi:hypothetical protein
MSSGFMTRTTSASFYRRLAPWAVVLLIGALLVGVLPSAQAQTGASAADAIPIGTDGKFAGTDGPTTSLWYKFNYIGGNQTVTATLTFEPPDSNRLDIFFFTGDPSNPTPTSGLSTLKDNVRTITFTDPGGVRVVYVKVENDHPDRSVSFVGSIAPTTAIATPTPTSAANPATPQSTPTTGPVANNATTAILLTATNCFIPAGSPSCEFSGTLNPGQAVWYRFYYGNPGADTTVSISVAPTADNADLNIYTSTDPANPGAPQGGSQVKNGNTISRHVNMSNAQLVFFSLADNGSGVIAYGGNVTPFVAPPATVTPTAAATGSPTAAPTATPGPVQQAPAMAHDARYFNETHFRIDDDVIFSYFQARGMEVTFGFPVSRNFTFLGCSVQIFQRQIAQHCSGANVQLMNVLDPEIFPYTRVNGSVFPEPDTTLKNSTPRVSDPDYATAILKFVRDNAPDQVLGQPVNFGQTFFNSVSPQQANTSDPNIIGLLDLEIWGAPISKPAADPGNGNFIYQRFQRGIMHYTTGQGTRGILLADYVKQILLGQTLPGGAPNPNLPIDLAQQAQGSKYLNQYCPGGTRWLCRPAALPDSDLTFAFEIG